VKPPVASKRALTLLYKLLPLVPPGIEDSSQRQWVESPVHFGTIPYPAISPRGGQHPYLLLLEDLLTPQWLQREPLPCSTTVLLWIPQPVKSASAPGLGKCLFMLLIGNPTSNFDPTASVISPPTGGFVELPVASKRALTTLYKHLPLVTPGIEDTSQCYAWKISIHFALEYRGEFLLLSFDTAFHLLYSIQMWVVPNQCLVAPNSHLVSMWDAIGYCTGPTHFANSENANLPIRIQIQCSLPPNQGYTTILWESLVYTTISPLGYVRT
jgi:hypothetical protein